jgi:Tol biopolymer transport system component
LAGHIVRTIDRAATHPEVSPTEDHVVASVSYSDSLDIWIFGDRGTETRLTTGGTNDFPVWSPDGRYIVYLSTGGDLPRLSIVRADGVGPHDVIWQGATAVRPTSWSSDGRFLALEAQSETTARDIWILPLEPAADGGGFDAASEPRRLHEAAYNEGGAVFSPDGRWLAYVSTETDRAEVYVESFPALDERIVISSGGGIEPRWSRDGTELFYRQGESLYVVRIVTTPELRADPSEELFDTAGPASNTHAHYDVVGNDGFVTRWERSPLDRGKFYVVTNLFERIESLAGGR